MKNILVFTDFSEVADNAAEYALKMAVELKANVVLFHAIDTRVNDIPYRNEGITNYDKLEKESLHKLDLLANKLEIVLNGEFFKPRISFFTKAGNLKDMVSSLVNYHKIELLVMGARLYPDYPGYLFGNKIREVVEEHPCSILLLHGKTKFRTIKNILYITDLRYCDLDIIEQLTSYANLLNAHVTILHVCTDGLPVLLNEEASAIFKDSIATQINYKHLYFLETESCDTKLAINKMFENQDEDVLVIAHKKYHFFNHLFRQHTKKESLMYSRLPIIII